MVASLWLDGDDCVLSHQLHCRPARGCCVAHHRHTQKQRLVLLNFRDERHPIDRRGPDRARQDQLGLAPRITFSRDLSGTSRKRDDHRTRFGALAKALPRALFDRFNRPEAERPAGM